MTNNRVKNLACCTSVLIFATCNTAPDLGIFAGNTDIGAVNHAGSVEYNRADGSYTLSASGTNMWFNEDELHYVWKKMSGDLSIAADIEWVGDGVDPHRKACLIIRQSLEPGSAYADAVIHGDGLTSLQYRDVTGGATREVQAALSAPRRIRLEKEGDYLSMSAAFAGEELAAAGGAFKLAFSEPFYVGLGLCAHNNAVIEKAVFSDVVIETIAPKADSLKKVASTLETIAIASFDRRVVYHTDVLIEAPNWSPGQTLIFNSSGLLYKIPVAGGEPELIPTGFARRINNDHGISPDGSQMVISDATETGSSLAGRSMRVAVIRISSSR